MKLYIKFIKNLLNILSFIAPKIGGKIAVKLFQKVRLKTIKKREMPFYQKVKTHSFKANNTTINYYELGEPTNRMVVLVHGWDSNAGSLSLFANELVAQNYYVISLDLPAHGHSQGTHTNLVACKTVLAQLIKYLNPNEKISIVGHSFGAAVVSYALADNNIKADKIVLLSANNKLKIIFDDYQRLIGFNNRIYKEVALGMKKIINTDLDKLILADKIKMINYTDLLIIHDKFDKVLPFESALEIKKAIPEITLIPFEKIGHYRMLWNKEVVNETVKFIQK